MDFCFDGLSVLRILWCRELKIRQIYWCYFGDFGFSFSRVYLRVSNAIGYRLV